MRVGLIAAALLGCMAGGASAAPPGDPARGEALYGRCLACHALAYNRTGPRHCWLFGRKAGGLADFDYSPAMRRAGWKWNESTLDRFLANPTAAVPGTTMGYAGIQDNQERADLIAWLKHATDSNADCPRR